MHSREMERLKWRSRRGLLELDIVLARFWADCGEELDEMDAGPLATLLAMADNDLLDLVMGRQNLPRSGPATTLATTQGRLRRSTWRTAWKPKARPH